MPTLAQQLPPAMQNIGLRPLMAFQLAVNPASVIGKTPGWDRRIGEITGGTFEGARLNGNILSGGSDWQSLREDGVLALNVRCIMQTDDGALIGLTYQGMRHGPADVMDKIAKGETVSPADYYLRIQPWFETASPKYAFLNRMLTVGIGHRLAAGPIYHVFEVM